MRWAKGSGENCNRIVNLRLRKLVIIKFPPDKCSLVKSEPEEEVVPRTDACVSVYVGFL